MNTVTLQETLETPLHCAEKESVLKVIRSARTPVIAADVSRVTGLPVLKVTYLLNRIASETAGHLIVDTAGGIAYKFDPGFENAYLLKGTGTLLQRAGRIALNSVLWATRVFCLAMFFALRVSFGIALLLSVLFVVILIIVVIIRFFASDSGDSGDSIDFSKFFESNWLSYWTLEWLWDWLSWSSYLSWEPTYQSQQIRTYAPQQSGTNSQKKSSFLDNCFTLLFGYGDPNANLKTL